MKRRFLAGRSLKWLAACALVGAASLPAWAKDVFTLGEEVCEYEKAASIVASIVASRTAGTSFLELSEGTWTDNSLCLRIVEDSENSQGNSCLITNKAGHLVGFYTHQGSDKKNMAVEVVKKLAMERHQNVTLAQIKGYNDWIFSGDFANYLEDQLAQCGMQLDIIAE